MNAGIVIATGLGVRAYGYEIGLPFILVKYGGSVLWGTMVYFLVGMVLGDKTIGGSSSFRSHCRRRGILQALTTCLGWIRSA